MERNRYIGRNDHVGRDAEEGNLEKEVRTLTDLELVLAAGGDGPVCWGDDPPPPPTGP